MCENTRGRLEDVEVLVRVDRNRIRVLSLPPPAILQIGCLPAGSCMQFLVRRAGAVPVPIPVLVMMEHDYLLPTRVIYLLWVTAGTDHELCGVAGVGLGGSVGPMS